MVTNSPLRAWVVKTSIAAAIAAWFALFAVVLVRIPREDRMVGLLGVALGWPVVYLMMLGMCWGMGKMVISADESLLYGSWKSLQWKWFTLMRGPMLWLLNIAVVLYPTVALVAWILGLCGVLHPPT